MNKKLILFVSALAMFFIGMGVTTLAYPSGGVFGRAQYRGYFTNAGPDSSGWAILNQSCASSGEYGPYNYNNGNNWCNAIPRDLNTASELITFITNRINNGVPNGSYGFGSGSYGDVRARTGAAFIVHTMLGTPDGQRSRPPSAAQMTAWSNLVNQYASAGQISWSTNYNFTLNSFFQGTDDSTSPNDDAFYDDTDDGLAIIFRSSPGGSGVYVIRRECANPVGNGNIGSVPPLQDFTMSGQTLINGTAGNISVAPGAAVTFSHTLTNTGPTSTSPTTIGWTTHNMPPSGTGQQLSSGNAGVLANGATPTVNTEASFNVPLGTASGTQYCRQVRWSPHTEAGSSGSGTTRCATVSAAYDLQPITGADKTTVQDGDTVTFTFTIDNVGSNDSPSVSCSTTGSQPSGLPGSPSTTCPQTFAWNDATPTTVATQAITISGQAPGSQVCRSLTVNPASPTVASRDSPNICVTVVKTPYVHFMGGDVWAGGGFLQPDGTCTNNQSDITTLSHDLGGGDGYAGSSVEYAGFALGNITEFGSASRALVSGAPAGATALARALTFSNTSASLGDFAAPQHCINDFASEFASVTAACPAVVNVAAPPSLPCRRVGGLTIGAGALPAAARQVYIVEGAVSVTGDITYPASYASIDELPSLVIIATGDIRVDGSVRQLDGIYITNGTFFTCQEKPALPTATCNSDLTVNGAVIANAADLYRTAGGEGGTAAARKSPAETFKLSPEVYLRNALNNTSQTVISTTDLRELPPRF